MRVRPVAVVLCVCGLIGASALAAEDGAAPTTRRATTRRSTTRRSTTRPSRSGMRLPFSQIVKIDGNLVTIRSAPMNQGSRDTTYQITDDTVIHVGSVTGERFNDQGQRVTSVSVDRGRSRT